MATLLHDAVMNPAEGNIPWLQGGTVGDGWRGWRSWGQEGGQGLSLSACRKIAFFIQCNRTSQESQGALGSKRFLP